MNRWTKCMVAAVVALTATASLPNVALAQALPPAADLIAKYVAAVGGKEAIMQITSMQTSATMEIPTMGLTASMEIWTAAPNKMAQKTSIPGLGDMAGGTNGSVAWDVNPMNGPRLLAGKELDQMLENADFYSNMLYPADRFAKMETVAMVDFNGEKAYKVLTVRKATHRESTQYFSVATGLLIGSESTTESQMGPMTGVQSIGSYKQFGTMKMPTKIEQTMGPQKMLLTTTNIVFNSVLDAAFDPPAQVKPLIKK